MKKQRKRFKRSKIYMNFVQFRFNEMYIKYPEFSWNEIILKILSYTSSAVGTENNSYY